MNVFFDNNTSPILASIIHGFISHRGDSAIHIRDSATVGLGIARNAADTEWIPRLGADARTWVVVTADRRIATVPAEREAFRRAGLKGLLLRPGYQKIPVNRQASILLWRWDDLIATLESFAPPTLIGVPVSKGGKLDPLQW